jgi:hypothetical protein
MTVEVMKMSKQYQFLSEGEQVLKELEGGWQAVLHGEKFEWSKSMFRFELLRRSILTNKRLILLKGEEVDYTLPLGEIVDVEADSTGVGNPYLRMKLKNGKGVSLFFTCVSVKMFLGALYMVSKQRSIVSQWVQAINNQILQMSFQGKQTSTP